jgi:trigger factor
MAAGEGRMISRDKRIEPSMQVTETSAQGLKREFKVSIPASDFQSKLDLRLEELGRTVKLPGFRPGKVPFRLLKQRFGKSVVGEVVERTVSDSSVQVLSERGLRPAGQPKIEVTAYADDAGLEFNMALELLPDVTPIDFSTLKLERLTTDVAEDTIDAALARLAERQKKSLPLATPRPAAKGDVVVIDFVGRIDGEEFPGGSATDHYLELGSDSFVPGFEEQLVGTGIGDHLDVKVTFPTDYPNEKLAGKEAVFAVTVKEIREPQPVAIDDEMAKALGMNDLGELRNAVRDQRANEFAQIARARMKRQLLDALADAHEFELPASLTESEFEAIWKQVETDRAQGQGDPEDAGKSDDQLKSEYREIAKRRVKLGLLLSEVGRMNNIEIGNDELSRAIMAEARRYPGRERQVIEFYQNTPQALAQVRAPLYEDKVVDFILDQAEVTERKVTPEELAAAVNEPPAGKTEGSATT